MMDRVITPRFTVRSDGTVDETLILMPRRIAVKVKAPWTAEQVRALNRWQTYGFVHEFTCGNEDDHGSGFARDKILIATPAGWICPSCNYTQDWAHDFMFEEQTNPLRTLGRRP